MGFSRCRARAENPAVNERQPTAESCASQLLVLAHGLSLRDRADLDRLWPDAAAAGAALLPLEPGQDDAAAALGRALPVDALRDLGVEVDRSSLVLFAGWCSDDQQVARLERRIGGPARLTVLDLREPLLAAIAAGSPGDGSERAARALLANVQRATSLLRRRGPVGLWLAALGAPVPVTHTCDGKALLRRLLGRAAGGSRIHAEPHQLTVACGSHRASMLLRARLADTFLGDAVAEDLGGGRLRLFAPRRVAFGRTPVHARAPHHDEACATAGLPRLPRTADRLDLAGLGVRCALAAAAHAELTLPLRARLEPEAAPARDLKAPDPNAPALAPDLLPLLRRSAGAVGDPPVAAAADRDARGDGP